MGLKLDFMHKGKCRICGEIVPEKKLRKINHPKAGVINLCPRCVRKQKDGPK